MAHEKQLENPNKGLSANNEMSVIGATEPVGPPPLGEDHYQFLPDKDFLTLHEAAAFLNCTVRTVRNMIRDSRLEAKRIRGGDIRIPRASILAAFEAYG